MWEKAISFSAATVTMDLQTLSRFRRNRTAASEFLHQSPERQGTDIDLNGIRDVNDLD
ncbi:hypothetical protein U1Q18_031728, partial [Sarracenia purpurea var. burkii]